MNKQADEYGRKGQEHFSGGRRARLTAKEEEAVRKGKGQVFPSLVVTDEDSPAVNMSSPGAAGAATGALGAGVGGAIGYGVGALTGNRRVGALFGALAGGVPSAFAGYSAKKKRNASILETMRRLSPNSVMRDLEANEIFEAEVARRSRALNKANLMASIEARTM